MPDNREELKTYRLEMAKERLHSSKILLEDGSYKDSIGSAKHFKFEIIPIMQIFFLYHCKTQKSNTIELKNLSKWLKNS